MKKYIIPLIMLCMILISGCQKTPNQAQSQDILLHKNNLTNYATSATLKQEINEETILDQMTTSTISRSLGTKGKLVDKREQNDLILQVVSNPKATAYAETKLGQETTWQSTGSAQGLIERINRFPYPETVKLYESIEKHLKAKNVGTMTLYSYEGSNQALTDLINERSASSYEGKPIHTIEFLVDQNSHLIKQLSWRVRGKERQGKKILLTSIQVNFVPIASDKLTDEDFAMPAQLKEGK